MNEEFDYIVVGAGSAGCVLAARLSEDPATRVLLLEAGPPDRSLWIHLPIGYGKTMWSPTYNWCFHTDPDPNMNGRRIYWPRGKTLGGSSSINGLIYIRGQREDYDHWAALGNPGWGYDDVLPYFIKSERNQRGASAFHGGDGPLKRVGHRREARADRGVHRRRRQQIGVPRNDDFNGAAQEGAGYYQLTTWKGWRCSTAKAYLRAGARGAPTCASRPRRRPPALVLEGRRAVGVRYRQGGADARARAAAPRCCSPPARSSRRSCCSCRASARAALLQRHGIAVVHDLPGVGENLQDHLQIRLIYECSKPITTNDQLNSLARPDEAGPAMAAVIAAGRWRWASTRAAASCARCRRRRPRRPTSSSTSPRLSADMAGGKVHPVLRLHDVGLPAAARIARPHPHPLARSVRAARDAAELPGHRARPRAPRWPA